MYKDEVVLSTNFSEVELFKKGKVRDIYQIKDELLIVATDRISAFDCILPDGIPYKGKILTGLSKFWFNTTQDIISNHLISSEEENLPRILFPFRKILKGRSMLVKKSEPVPIECVVRGYLAGSVYKEYRTHHSICGIALPQKLRLADRLPEPIFTPATKAEIGHDVNISKEKMKEMIGSELTEKLEKISLKIYKRASKFLDCRGFILSDTKLEFGFHHGEVILIDELLTPDSSRFWSKKEYKPGSSPISFDKQFLRDYLSELDWDKT
ncbi:unnamed protein product, partial [marine sediment metagenome]